MYQKDINDPGLKEREFQLLCGEWFERAEEANKTILLPLEATPGEFIPSEKRAEKFMNRLQEAQEYAASAMASAQQQMEPHPNLDT
ncbi:hypothetical protein K3495_g6119 [Podosphaera aphanis]|nr:hypothetical protein K3495_g6119 [Podosphaera aphanis]